MKEYLTARQASKIAEEARSFNGSFMRVETDSIMQKIANAASAGKQELGLACVPHEVVQARLNALGYSIKAVSDQRDGDWASITWGVTE